MKTNPLVALGEEGQSPWLDYIHRGMISSGELARRIADDGIRGVTSNPTIFEKAVASGHDYDGQIAALAKEGAPLPAAYKRIVTDDIRAAADVLRTVYDATRGDDGYVSLEVDPDLARDTRATIARARELFDAVGRPNVMIKIPGTREGLPAVEETIASGIPVNVTLIFSVRRYAEVVDAYMKGVERLVAAGSDPRVVASVASFFVSRVDTAVDPMLLSVVERWPGSPKAETALSLLGKTAVANARLAYARFGEFFSSERWNALAARGARRQRPLWASTGTKNPKYSDVKYVEELIGPDTVNTMPPQTMDAFRDHGSAADALEGSAPEAKAVLSDLGLLDIGIEEVCARLEDEGVKSFLESYRKLLSAIEGRLKESRPR
ncbi:MAG: transaldolase [Deltaproteobacteria bacterium]|nr:MAG: transaldolase [Deltaproteobacteria bacterium]